MTVTHADTVALALFLALCPECGCGRWVPDARAVDLWLKHHPHEGWTE
jgi:hypothetical protein